MAGTGCQQHLAPGNLQLPLCQLRCRDLVFRLRNTPGGDHADTFHVSSDGDWTLRGGVGDDLFDINAALSGSVDGETGDDILQGTGGRILGDVTIDGGDVLSPGHSSGILPSGNLTFDNGSTYLVEIDDDSDAAHPGGVAGMGHFGWALEFDGVDDLATFQDPDFDVGTKGTLNFWVNFDNTGVANQFFEGPENAGFEFQYRTNIGGQIYGRTTTVGGDFVIRSGNDAATLNSGDGWHNIQYTWDFATSVMRIYVDGAESTYLPANNQNLTWASVVDTANGLMHMGYDPGNPGQSLDGMIDDVAWYRDVLDSTELGIVRTTGASAHTDLVANWKFDAAPTVDNSYIGDSGTDIALYLQQLPPAPPVSGYGVVTPAAAVVLNNVFFNEVAGDYADSNQTLDPSNITGTAANPFFSGDDPNTVYAGTTLAEFYRLRFGSSAAYQSTEFEVDIATLIPHIGANQQNPVGYGTEDILVVGSEFDDLVVVTFTGANEGYFTYTRNVTGMTPDSIGTFNFVDLTSFTFDAYGADDVFIVIQPTADQGSLFSLSGGIAFNGGTDIGNGNALLSDIDAGSDTLVLLTSTTGPAIVDSATYVFGNETLDGHTGTITIVDGARSTVITFTGTEPIRDELSVNERTFMFASTDSDGDETITVSTPDDTVQMLPSSPFQPEVTLRTLDNLITSSLGASVSFNSPHQLLEIHAGIGDDIVSIESLHTDYRAELVISGDNGDDTIHLNSDLTLGDATVGNTGDLTVTAESIHVTADVATTGTGNISLIASRNVRLLSDSRLTTVDGDLLVQANQQVTRTAGHFVGVELNAGLVQATGSGTVTIQGRGGDHSSGNQYGVWVHEGGEIRGGTSGLVTVEGTGGDSTGDGNIGVLLLSTMGTITSSGANVSITGTGGGAGGSLNNIGIAVQANSMITAGASGTVTVAGRGSLAATGGTNFGVQVEGTGSTITSSGGHVQVTGTEGSGTTGVAIRVGTNGTITTATQGGTVTLIGDSMSFASTATVSAPTSSSVTLLQRTPGVEINLGTAGDPFGGPLNLTDSELDRITAGELHIGNSISGAITVSSDINLSTASTAGGGAVSVLCLTSSSTVSAVEGVGGGLVVADLSIVAGGVVNFTDLTTNVTNLAIDSSTGDVTIVEADGFTVTTVCGVTGIDTDAGAVRLTVQNGNLTVADTAAANDIDATTGVTLTLNGANNVFSVNNLAGVLTAAGGMTITADNMALTGTLSASGQTVVLQQKTALRLINLGTETTGHLSLTDVDLDGITASRLDIGNSSSGAISISSDIALNDGVGATLSPEQVTTLCLVSSSTVTASAGGIVVSDLAVVAGGAVTFTNASTNVTHLAVDTSTGNVTFVEAGGLIVTTVCGVTGIDTDVGAATLTVTTGNLTVVDTTATNDIAVTADITVTLLANDALFTINAGADIETTKITSGLVTVSSDKMNLAGSITTAGQTVRLQNRVEADAIDLGSVVDTSSHTLELSNAELDRITASRLIIGSGTMGAMTVSGHINLSDSPAIPTLHLVTIFGITATAAGIQVANLAVTANGALNFTSGTTQIDTLALTTTGTVQFTDANALTIGTVDRVIGVTTTDDDVTLTTGGELTIDDDIVLGSGNIRLSVTGNLSQNAGDTIVANGLALMVFGTTTLTEANDVNTLAASTSGAIRATDSDGLEVGTLTVHATSVTGITTTNDHVTLTTGGTLTINDDIALGAANLTLDATGAVTQGSGDTIAANGLRLLGAGPFTLEDAANNVSTLAANTGGAVAYRDANSLTIGSVTGNVGSTSGITTTSDNATVCLVTGVLSVSSGISVGGATVRLQTLGGSLSGAGSITAETLGLRSTGAGSGISLTAVSSNVNTLAAITSGAFSFIDADGFSLGTVTTSGCFTPAVTGLTAGGDVELCAVSGDIALNAALSAVAFTIRLDAAAGQVTQTASGIITATNLGVHARNSIDLDSVNNKVTGVFAADSTTMGHIEFNDLDGFTIGSVTAGSCLPAIDGVRAASGHVIATSTGSISVNKLVSASRDVSLAATGSASDLTISVNSGVTSTGGNIRFDAGAAIDMQAAISTQGGHVAMGAGTNVTSTEDGSISTSPATDSRVNGGNVTVDAGLAGPNASGSITLGGFIHARGANDDVGAGTQGGIVTLNAHHHLGGSVLVTNNIFTTGGDGVATGGQGGRVVIEATHDVSVTNIGATGGHGTGGAAGSGGSVSITAHTGTMVANSVTTFGGNGTVGGMGGHVTLSSDGSVSVLGSGGITTRGGLGTSGAGVSGGSVAITSTNGGITLDNVNVNGVGGLNGGDSGHVTLTADGNIEFTTPATSIFAVGGHGSAGDGGHGGTVVLTSHSVGITVREIVSIGGAGHSGGSGSDITLDAEGDIAVLNVVASGGGQGDVTTGGAAGDIAITSRHGGIVLDTVSSQAGSGNTLGGVGGDISLIAQNAISVTNSITTNGGMADTGDGGDSGNLLICASSGAITVTAIHTGGGLAFNGTGGNAGNILFDNRGSGLDITLNDALIAVGGTGATEADDGADASVSLLSDGALVDASDGIADVISGSLQIVAASGIAGGTGTNAVMEIEVKTLAATTSTGGMAILDDDSQSGLARLEGLDLSQIATVVKGVTVTTSGLRSRTRQAVQS